MSLSNAYLLWQDYCLFKALLLLLRAWLCYPYCL